MKYSNDEAVSEIMKRSRNIRHQKLKNTVRALSAAVLFTFAAGLGAGIYYTDTGGYMNTRTSYGSFLLPGSAGGYVLAAVISFTLGVALTLFLIWKQKAKGNDSKRKNSEGDDEKQ